MSRRIVVIGGGIAGLACAHRLMCLAPDADLRVVEAAPRPGGWIRTKRSAGFVQELGPETIVDDGSGLDGLIRELGMEPDLLPPEPAAGRPFILDRGRLRPLPTTPGELLRSSLLSPWSRLQVLFEPMRRRGANPEETVAECISRRFSPAVLERLVEPFIAGIRLGSPERLELASAFPRVFEAERDGRSLIRTWRSSRGRSRVIGFRGGNEDLVTGLRLALGERLWCGREVTELRRGATGFEVLLGGQRPTTLHADRVVLAIPSHGAARLLRACWPQLAEACARVPFFPLASVHLGFEQANVPRDVQGFGFLVPRGERSTRALICLYSSQLFRRRARPGTALFRVFFGGGRDPDAPANDDAWLQEQALRTLHEHAGIAPTPLHLHVWRHARAVPSMEPGHRALTHRIDSLLEDTEGIHVCGQSYRASGVAGCIRDARRTAQRIIRDR